MATLMASLVLATTGTSIKSSPSPSLTPPIPAAPRVAQISFVVPSSVLSSADVVGTLTIANIATEDLGYSPGSVSFLIRQPNGTQQEWPLVTVITHIMVPFWIPAGASQSFTMTMPSCEVIADPCEQKVIVKFSLITRSGERFQFETDERTYNKMPDATATFEIAGLSG